MVLTLLPLGSMVANAAVTITSVDGLGKLGSGFNMLGDRYLGDVPMRQIFVSTSGVTAQFDSNPISTSSYSYITSMSDYFSNEASTINVSFGMGSEASAKLTIKIVELDLEQKYRLDISSSNSSSSSSFNRDETEYMLLEYMHQIGTYTLWLDNETQISRLWQTDENGNFTVLHQDFVDSLLNDDPDVFFKNYGSHLITQYTAGGTATSSYFGQIHYENSSDSFQQNSSVSEDSEGVITKHKELESIYSSSSGSSSGNSVKRGESMARGGTGNFAWDEASASAWASTVDQDHHIAMVDDNLMLLPMWELLLDRSQTDRRIELEQYFNDHVDSQYAELYGKYIYAPTGNKDYTGYTLIRTAEELFNIRNNLNGKYVLLNNIDLSGYRQWTPIGTQTDPFTGVLDGNGNTVSGMTISQCDSYAGLLGYNAGTVENLTVSGNIQADATGSANDAAYIGGIAGFNTGVISNCRNLVTVNGSLTVLGGSSAGNTATEDFFTQFQSAIEDAKAAEVQTLTDNANVAVGLTPVHLTGTASNVSISISGSASNDPAFIVLNNAHITGKISHTSDRKVCIISVGSSNSLTGPADHAPVDIGTAQLYLTGFAELTITGGTGSNGAKGEDGVKGDTGENGLNQVRGEDGKKGTDGDPGKQGNNGSYSVVAQAIHTAVENRVTLRGGNGGNGGVGGAGGTGGTGGQGFAGVIGNAGAGNGGTGGKGGQGGAGGDGAQPVSSSTDIQVYCGDLYLYNGNGGNGSSGGVGGKGGTGGNTTQWLFYCGQPGGGGSGGDGGKGGSNGKAAKYQHSTDRITVTSPDSTVYIALGQSGAVGTGARGGAVGSAGTAALDRDPQASGSDKTKIYAENGTVSETIDYSVYEISSLATQHNVYRYYQNKSTFSSLTSPLSIGSSMEQVLIERMLLLSGAENANVWIGLEVVRVLSGNFSTGEILLKWRDGTYIKITKRYGNILSASRVLVDENNNVTQVIGDAYVNFSLGEPDNATNTERYIYLTSGGRWSDAPETASYTYITETRIQVETGNTYHANALVVGGICGFNAGTIRSSYNAGSISVNKITSTLTGVSAYAGGICGYNNAFISNSVNTGAVSTLAVSNSMSHYADAYAFNIGFGGNVTDCSGYIKPSANALSSNTLEISQTDDPNQDSTATDPVKDAVDAYWKNSDLVIEAVRTTEYLRGGSFMRNTVELSMNGLAVHGYRVRNNFYNAGIATVTLLYTDGTAEYTRTIPVQVIAETPQSVEIYQLPQTEFTIGDAFSSEGLVLVLIFDNGTKKLLSSKNFTVTEPTVDTLGTQEVTVHYAYDENIAYSCSYPITVNEAAYSGGVAVTGNITSYGSSEPVTVALWQGNECLYTITVTDGTYALTDVTPGSYTLMVSKQNHATRSYEITADGTDIAQDVKICLMGDVNGDGKVNIGDTARAYSHVKNASPLTDPYSIQCADVSGDTKLNIGDVARIYAHVKNTSKLW